MKHWLATLGLVPGSKVSSYKGFEKKAGLVADDCILLLEASVDNFIELHTVLSHFSTESGLRINFNKSSLMYFNPGPWLLNPAVSLYSQISLQDGVTYLGTHLGSSDVLTQNVPRAFVTMKDLLKSRPVQTTSLSGRILQVKSLAASRFVYLFQLLPTPEERFLGGLSLHLNHLIGSHLTNYDWPFGTLPLGLFGSNLDTRDLGTYPRTYSSHF